MRVPLDARQIAHVAVQCVRIAGGMAGKDALVWWRAMGVPSRYAETWITRLKTLGLSLFGGAVWLLTAHANTQHGGERAGEREGGGSRITRTLRTLLAVGGRRIAAMRPLSWWRC